MFQAVDVHTLVSIENFASKETLEHAIYKMSRKVYSLVKLQELNTNV